MEIEGSNPSGVTRFLEPWCSGQTWSPVKAQIAGSNPVGSATKKGLQECKPFLFAQNHLQDLAQKELGALLGRVLKDLLGRALLDDLAVIEE